MIVLRSNTYAISLVINNIENNSKFYAVSDVLQIGKSFVVISSTQKVLEFRTLYKDKTTANGHLILVDYYLDV